MSLSRIKLRVTKNFIFKNRNKNKLKIQQRDSPEIKKKLIKL